LDPVGDPGRRLDAVLEARLHAQIATCKSSRSKLIDRELI